MPINSDYELVENEKKLIWIEKEKSRVRALFRYYHDGGKEYNANWVKNNKSKKAKYFKKWYESNLEYNHKRSKERRAKKVPCITPSCKNVVGDRSDTSGLCISCCLRRRYQ